MIPALGCKTCEVDGGIVSGWFIPLPSQRICHLPPCSSGAEGVLRKEAQFLSFRVGSTRVKTCLL